MNLVTGQIVDTAGDGPWRKAKIRVRGVIIRGPLMFLTDAGIDDRILVERGFAIAVVGGGVMEEVVPCA